LKYYKQLFKHDPGKKANAGDCYRTALACLLGKPPDNLPYFLEEPYDLLPSYI